MYLLLNCKSPAPFGAARFQNTTTVAGRHTFHKAVFTLARYALWLPGTFHLTLLSPPLRILVDYSGYPYNLSIVEAEVEHVGRDYAFNVFILADTSALAPRTSPSSFIWTVGVYPNSLRSDFTSAK
jgi:hypothetical protein